MINTDVLTDEEWDFVSKEGCRVRTQLARARREGVVATLTLRQWLGILNKFNNKCAYCQQRGIEVMEHLTPISLGGGTTAENCVPACGICNTRKINRSAHVDHETQSIVIHPLSRRTTEPSNIPTHWLSAGEAARIAHVTPSTINEWTRQGLHHSRVGTNGRYYSIDPESLKAFLLGKELAYEH